MWHLYNKTYDLTNFLKNHPGGEDILLRTKDQKDVTALFEIYHAFADKDKIKQILNKYEITDSSSSTTILTKQYDYTNYNQLVNRVKELFPNHENRKSTTSFNLFYSFLFGLYVYSFYYAMLATNHTFYKCIMALIAGFSYISLGFNVMHNASHYAISENPKINLLLTKIWSSWALWNPVIWFYHHVYNHHSFTSQEKQDPDLYHLLPFARKTKTYTRIHPYLLSIQDKLVPFILFVFPGQYLGQALSYAYASYKKQIFSIPIPNQNYYDDIDAILIATHIYCLLEGLYLPTILYILSLNFFYSINVVPDHDTYESSVENHYSGDDWCRIQICNSANFANQNTLWTHLFGGINYQIEHHLFPNVAHIHYPKISPIVKEYCKENHIPYVHHDSVIDAYKSFLKKIAYMKTD